MKFDKLVLNDIILNRLLESLSGQLPFMNINEKKDYNNSEIEIKANYKLFNHFLETNVETITRSFILQNFQNYNESINHRNSILNDLYYKDGIRDGIKLMLECFEKNFND